MKLITQSFASINEEIYFRENYISLLEQFSNTKNITIITGQRRVGKSFIVLGFLKKKEITMKECFYLNKEFDIANEIQDSKNLNDLFEEYKTKYGEPKYVIIDEIQDIKNWDFFVRGIFATKKYKIIITGSNSQLLSSEFSTFLTGRYLKFDVLSFSYTEFLAFTKKENSKKSFEEYTRWGGLPEVLLQKNDLLKSHYLSDTISTMLYQDIVKRYKIENEIVAEKILKFLGANLGNLTSLRNIEQQFIQEKMKVGISTISNYVKYFENAYLIRKIDRIGLKGKEFFKFIGKYFFTDIGMRNSLIGIEINYISKILENIIYNELLYRGYDIKIGVFGNKEIDFVVTKGNEKKYIQVCYLLATDDVIDREFGNLLEIKDNYEKIVISFDEIGNFDYKGIRWVNILKWLVEK